MEKTVALFLAAVLFCSTLLAFPIQVKADGVPYVDEAQKAVDITEQVIDVLHIDDWSEIGKELKQYVNYLDQGLNIGNTILKFLGFGKKSQTGPTIEEKMYDEIQEMHREMKNISADLQNLIDKMDGFIKQQEFNDRMREAMGFLDKWNDFNAKYVYSNDSGMEHYKNLYNAYLLKDIETWCKNSDSRKAEYIDNTAIVVAYDSEGKLILNPDEENDIPQTAVQSITLEPGCLPQAMKDYSFETYQAKLGNVIKENIRTALTTGATDGIITVNNYPLFTKEGWAQTSSADQEAALDKLCGDAVESLVYRISLVTVNQKSSVELVTNILDSYTNYCKYLLAERNGLKAITQSMMLTCNFEGELKEAYQNLCGYLALQTSEYATFALDILGKYRNASTAKANEVSTTWHNTEEAILSAINSLTGEDSYCYVTGTCVKPEPMEQIYAYAKADYVSGKIKYGGISTLYRGKMVGEGKTAMMLNLYKAKYEGKDFETYLRQHSYGQSTVDDTYRFLVDWKSEDEVLTQADNITLWEGDWNYATNKEVSSKDVNYNGAAVNLKRMGAFFDRTNQSILSNRVILAVVVKGEQKSGKLTTYLGPADLWGAQYEYPRFHSNIEIASKKYYTLSQIDLPKDNANAAGYNPFVMEEEDAGSVFSGGNLWILIAAGVIAVVVLAIVIKKKPTGAEGDPTEDEA